MAYLWSGSSGFPGRIGFRNAASLGAETRTNDKLNPYNVHGVNSGIQWWEVDTLTTVPQTSQPHGTIKLEVEVSKPLDFSKNLEIDLIM